ncbi:MAG TPA: hypothetical protein VIT91_20705 [Chthoniobacterales bacterium]
MPSFTEFFLVRGALSATAALLLTVAGGSAQSVDKLLKEGSVFDGKFQAVAALKFYLAAEKLEPNDPRVLVRIARQYRHLMVDATTNEEKLRLGRVALQYAQKATALAPNLAEAQLSVAITYGKLLPLMSRKEQVETSMRIKNAVDRALALDPRSDLAWHVLGRWHRVLADVSGLKRMLAGAVYGSLPKGSNEEAARCLQKAVDLNPTRPMHYIELGRVYAQMGREDDARRFIAKGLAMPNVDKDDDETKARGRVTLAQLR